MEIVPALARNDASGTTVFSKLTESDRKETFVICTDMRNYVRDVLRKRIDLMRQIKAAAKKKTQKLAQKPRKKQNPKKSKPKAKKVAKKRKTLKVKKEKRPDEDEQPILQQAEDVDQSVQADENQEQVVNTMLMNTEEANELVKMKMQKE